LRSSSSLSAGCGSSESARLPDGGTDAPAASSDTAQGTDAPPAPVDTAQATDGPSAAADTATSNPDAAADGPLPAGTIGAAGGTHLISGAQISVPAGALAQNTVLSIKASTSGYPVFASGDTLVSTVYAFEPHGQTFAKPVTVAITHTGGTDGVLALVTASPGAAWMDVTGATSASSTAMQGNVDHFTFFAVVKRKQKLLWEQVFGKWDCTAAGRPPFAFEVIQKTQFGSDADWIDLGTMVMAKASVQLTQLYLSGTDEKPFRNFEYKSPTTGILSSLLEWSLTAGTAAPYSCLKR
jgi:hypothetical protein